MTEDAKKRLVENISGSLAKVSRKEIVERSLGHFGCADKDLADRLERAIKALR